MSIAIDRPDTQSARRARLVAEGVVAGYIHDLSAAVTPAVVRREGRAGQRGGQGEACGDREGVRDQHIRERREGVALDGGRALDEARAGEDRTGERKGDAPSLRRGGPGHLTGAKGRREGHDC